MNTKIDMTTQIERAPDIVFTQIQGETVMLHVEEGAYFGLGDVGTFLWEKMDRPVSLEQLTAMVCDEFEVDAATARADIQAFVSDLQDKNMIRTVTKAA